LRRLNNTIFHDTFLHVMTILMVGIIPVFFIFWVSLFPEIKIRDRVIPAFIKGILVSLPAFALFWLLQEFYSITYDPTGIFVYHLIHDVLFQIGIALILYFSFFRCGPRCTVVEKQVHLFSFCSGFYLIFSIMDLLFYAGFYDFYLLFILPVIKVALIFIIPSLIVISIEERSYFKLLYMFLSVVLPIGLAFCGYFYHLHYFTYAYMIFAGIAVVLISGALLIKKALGYYA
jgi:hypothetical protein